MSVGGGVGAVMDVAPLEEGIVLTVGNDELAEALGLHVAQRRSGSYHDP